MTDDIIQVENVRKKFCRSLRHGMWYTGTDLVRRCLGLPVATGKLRTNEFWALRDVSFSLQRGESLAIIGSNGSGKSTLLNLLNGVLMPDQGRIVTQGRVAALIGVGAGFHPMLTGRENIFVNGMILGMSSREIRDRFDAIVDFSEVGEFIDTPVKHYSSGMYVRLGFAIAIHAPVDILLLDEVLAVGDLAFAVKCLRRIGQFRAQGGSAILVSHAMQYVKLVFDSALWIEKGEVRRFGPALEVANEYESYMMAKCESGAEIIPQDAVHVVGLDYQPELQYGQKLVVEVDIEFGRCVERPVFCLHLHCDGDDALVFSHHSDTEHFQWESLVGRVRLRMVTHALLLRRGAYRLSFSISERELINYLVWQYKQHPLIIRSDRNCFGIADAGVTFEVVKP